MENKIDCSNTLNYFIEKSRMTRECEIGCCNCPLDLHSNNNNLTCDNLELIIPGVAIEIVQKWSDEHPRLNNISKLLSAFPDAKMINGVPEFCVRSLGLCAGIACDDKSCAECWNNQV